MKVRILLLLLGSLFALDAQAQNYVVYNGGVGVDERADAPSSGTKLVFFVKGGSYLANVKVTVKDQGGNTVVDTVTKGPWLILDLPEGKYRVRAEVDGQAQGGMLEVTGKSQKVGYMFKDM